MVERARFRPARNAADKPVVGTYLGKINWRLASSNPLEGLGAPPPVDTATKLWFACGWGETAKLIMSDLPSADVARRAFAACTPLEERIGVEMRKTKRKEMDPTVLIPALKAEFAKTLPTVIDGARAALRGEVRK